jgi:hypothetical protein
MINYDIARGVVVNNDLEKSVLIVSNAQKRDDGNYTCTPSNARPTSISVHILNGKCYSTAPWDNVHSKFR